MSSPCNVIGVSCASSPDGGPLLHIGEISRRTGLSVHALRFYEREGLFPNGVQRAPDGRRTYTASDADWLDLCVKFRSSGMPLSEIRRYTELVQAGEGNEKERLALLRLHQARVVAQMEGLAACLGIISLKVRLYEESTEVMAKDPIWSRK